MRKFSDTLDQKSRLGSINHAFETSKHNLAVPESTCRIDPGRTSRSNRSSSLGLAISKCQSKSSMFQQDSTPENILKSNPSNQIFQHAENWSRNPYFYQDHEIHVNKIDSRYEKLNPDNQKNHKFAKKSVTFLNRNLSDSILSSVKRYKEKRAKQNKRTELIARPQPSQAKMKPELDQITLKQLPPNFLSPPQKTVSVLTSPNEIKKLETSLNLHENFTTLSKNHQSLPVFSSSEWFGDKNYVEVCQQHECVYQENKTQRKLSRTMTFTQKMVNNIGWSDWPGAKWSFLRERI